MSKNFKQSSYIYGIIAVLLLSIGFPYLSEYGESDNVQYHGYEADEFYYPGEYEAGRDVSGSDDSSSEDYQSDTYGDYYNPSDQSFYTCYPNSDKITSKVKPTFPTVKHHIDKEPLPDGSGMCNYKYPVGYDCVCELPVEPYGQCGPNEIGIPLINPPCREPNYNIIAWSCAEGKDCYSEEGLLTSSGTGNIVLDCNEPKESVVELIRQQEVKTSEKVYSYSFCSAKCEKKVKEEVVPHATTFDGFGTGPLQCIYTCGNGDKCDRVKGFIDGYSCKVLGEPELQRTPCGPFNKPCTEGVDCFNVHDVNPKVRPLEELS